MRLFPLVEYRPKVFGELPFSWLIQGWTLRGASSITTSFYFDTWVGRACTTNITCLNALPQLIHLLTAVTLFSIGKKVFGSRYIASIVLLLWLISVPFLETMAWQALDLDKIAALSTTLGAAMGIYFYRKPYSMQNILLANVVILSLVVIGYNSKASAWVLVPGLWLMPIIGNGIGLKNWCKYLITPTLYGLLSNLVWYRNAVADEFTKSHISSGDIETNIYKFIGYFHGSLYPTTTSKIAFIAVAGFLTWGAIRKSSHCRFGLWCVSIVIGGLIIHARTQYGAGFYMLVSQVFYALALGAVLTECMTFLRKHGRKGRLVGVLALMAIVLNFLPGFRYSYSSYNPILLQSDNYRQSLKEIDEVFQDPATHNLKLVQVIVEIMDYRYVDGWGLQRLISEGFPIDDTRISYEDVSVFESKLQAADTIYVVFDKDMNIANIIKP